MSKLPSLIFFKQIFLKYLVEILKISINLLIILQLKHNAIETT